VNLSSHPYFHLGDLAEEDVLDHEFIISADRYLPTDSRQIPTGELRPVAGSVFDFRSKTSLRKRIRRAEPQLLLAHGYDHCFVLNKTGASGPEFAARAFSPRTGRVAEIFTTQPGLQFYSGNNLTGAIAGRNGVALRQSSGFALEAQNFPNAPNTPDFPSAVLRPGERYHHIIVYQFAAI
jgi:aldose 1-epimerase